MVVGYETKINRTKINQTKYNQTKINRGRNPTNCSIRSREHEESKLDARESIEMGEEDRGREGQEEPEDVR